MTARYLRGVNLIARKQDGGLQYYLFNAHGDVTERTDSNGTVLKRYKYDALGNEENPEKLDVNPFRYCGEYFDKETGEIYLRARYYEPRTGRFVNEDSIRSVSYKLPNQQEIADPLSLNLYNYCYSNPVRYRDSSGNAPEDITRTLARQLIANPMIAYATQQGWFSDLFYDAGFVRDSGGVYHTRQDALQQYGGYNDFYDTVFRHATSMKAQPFPFTYNGQDYRFWAWKGDYLNLGAGTELGIYTRMSVLGKKTDHWLVDTSLALPMTMTLRDNKGNLIASYNPSEPQWWATSFNPHYQNMNAGNLRATVTVNFAGNIEMYNAFHRQWGGKKDSPWTFNKKKYTATLNF